RADGLLIRHDKKDSHRAIQGGERLFLFNCRALSERLERGRDQSERVKRKLELSPRRTGFDLLPQAMETIGNLLRLQDRHCLVKSGGLQVQEQRHRDSLQIVNTFRCGHGRTREHTLGPWLLAQAFRKHRRELLEFVDVSRIAYQRERKFTRLL